MVDFSSSVIPAERYQRHKYTTESPQTLYHVYDNLSQSPYQPGLGIRVKCSNSARTQQIIAYDAVVNHLHRSCREGSQLISLYDNENAALEEADRRKQAGTAHRCAIDPSSVRIAEVSVLELDKKGVFHFSRDEILELLGAPAHDPLAETMSMHEWFVVHGIPDSAVSKVTEWTDGKRCKVLTVRQRRVRFVYQEKLKTGAVSKKPHCFAAREIGTRQKSE